VRTVGEPQLPEESLPDPELSKINSKFTLEAFALKEGRGGMVFAR